MAETFYSTASFKKRKHSNSIYKILEINKVIIKKDINSHYVGALPIHYGMLGLLMHS